MAYPGTSGPGRIRFGFSGIFALMLMIISTQQAQPSETYDLRGVEFSVPAGWEVTYSKRDQEFDFVSPDERFQLWARWWFPDEPLLGFADIEHHETRVLAGQEALMIQSETAHERMLTAAFPRLDAEGEQFLWQLIAAPTVPVADQQALFETLLASLKIDGVPALDGPGLPAGKASVPSPTAVPVPQPPSAPGARQQGRVAPPAPPVPQPSSEGAVAVLQTPSAVPLLPSSSGSTAAVPPPPKPGGSASAARFIEPQGAFSLPLPDGWVGYSAQAVGLRQAVLLPPKGDALVLAVLATSDAKRSAMQVMQDFHALLLADTVIVKDISDEAWTRIAGAEAHAVEYLAKIYSMNGIAMPYTRGRVWVHRGPEDAEEPFLLVSVRSETASADLADTLHDIVAGFTPGAGPPAVPEVAAAPEPTPDPIPDPAPENIASPLVLFDGQSLDGLITFGFDRGDFATQAALTTEGLALSVPNGLAWARLGMSATAAPVTLPAGDMARRVRVAFDGARSNGFVLAFSPVEAATEDPDNHHVLRLQLYTEENGLARAKLSIAGAREIVSRQFRWPQGRSSFDIIICGNGLLFLYDESGAELVHLRHEHVFPNTLQVAQIYGRPSYRNGPVDLVLGRVVTDEHRFALHDSVDAPILAAVEDQPLFAGWGLGGLWYPNERREGHFAAFSRLRDGALRIAWDKEQGGDYTGIASNGALLWLDGFHGLAEARLTVDVDVGSTGDFEISLANSYFKAGDLSPQGSYVLRFRRESDGSFSASSQLRKKGESAVVTQGLTRLPDRVTLVLRPGRIQVEAEGVSTEPLAWPALVDGAGLRLSIHAMPDSDGRGALSLWHIARTIFPEPPKTALQPAPGVAPLPEYVFFEPPIGPEWQGHSWGKAEFDTLAVPMADGLRLARRDPVPDKKRILLSGSTPVVALDERLDNVSYVLTMNVEPAADLGVTLALAKTAPVVPRDATVALSLEVIPTGPDAGGLKVHLQGDGAYRNAMDRVLPAEWWSAHWDGSVRLQFSSGWVAVHLADRLVMRLPSTASGRRQRLMATVLPGGFDDRSRGAVTLRRIAGGWIAPDGMTETERWKLVELEEFDADSFADMLARDLMEGTQ